MLARQLLASAFYFSGIWRVLATRSTRFSTARILMYHRVMNPRELPYPIEPGIFVRPETFAQHCEFLNREMQVLPLAEMVESLLAGKSLPPKAVAITFDDGYRDFHQYALPILSRSTIPATVFLPTAFIGTDRMFPFDMFAAELERARAHPELREAFHYALDDARLRELVDLIYHCDNTNSGEVLSQIIAHLKSLDRTKRGVILDSIAQLSTPGFYPRTFMSWNEIRECQEAGITFASHSHSHPYLDELLPEEIHEDTRLSFQTLEKHKITALGYYCFPNGNFSSTALTVLGSLGVQAAFTTGRGNMTSDTSPVVLARLGIHDDISATTSGLVLRMLAKL